MSKVKNRDIICKSCLTEIESREELVSVFDAFEIVPFHSACYSNQLKSYKSFFVSNEPINSMGYNIKAGLFGVVGLILIFIKDIRFLGIILMISPLIRLYSWFKIERFLK